MIRICVKVMIFVLMVPLALTAQDRPVSADELLSFYPADTYRRISFESVEVSKSEESYPFYRWMTEQLDRARKKYFKNYNPQTDNALAESMRFSTIATVAHRRFIEFDIPREFDVVNYKKGRDELSKKYKKALPIETIDKEKKKMIVYGVVEIENRTLQVYHLYDVQGAIKAAIAEGSMSETGEKRQGKPIFKYSQKNARSESTTYAWPTDTGELLMADSVEGLDSMIETIRGVRASILSQREYLEAFEMIPDLGHSWTIASFENMRWRDELTLDYVTDDKMKENLRDSISNSPLFRITNQSLDDTYTLTSIDLFENIDIAAQRLELYKKQSARLRRMLNRPSLSKKVNEMQVFMAENTEYKQKGAAIIGEFTYDQEYVKMMEKRYQAISKYRQKQ